MKPISKISVVSKINTGLQVLTHHLTPTEKKILIIMLNSNMNQGKVRNKTFFIDKTGENTADIKIGTTAKSITLGRNETTYHKVKIKYS
jgi:hypothetical protein